MTQLSDFAQKHNLTILHDCSDKFFTIYSATSTREKFRVNCKNSFYFFPENATNSSRLVRSGRVRILGVVHIVQIPSILHPNGDTWLLIGDDNDDGGDYGFCYSSLSKDDVQQTITNLKSAENWFKQKKSNFTKILDLIATLLNVRELEYLRDAHIDKLKLFYLYNAWCFIRAYYKIPKLLEEVPKKK